MNASRSAILWAASLHESCNVIKIRIILLKKKYKTRMCKAPHKLKPLWTLNYISVRPDRCSLEAVISDFAYLVSVKEKVRFQVHHRTALPADWYFISYWFHTLSAFWDWTLHRYTHKQDLKFRSWLYWRQRRHIDPTHLHPSMHLLQTGNYSANRRLMKSSTP